MRSHASYLPAKITDEVRLNVQNLPPFISAPPDQKQSFRYGLANEPYSFYDDHVRPTLAKVRQIFRYAISSVDPMEVTCLIGKRMIASYGPRVDTDPDNTTTELPAKRTSNYSVLSLYDASGLGGVYAYLSSLYEHKYNATYPAWLYVYLEGSLIMLRPEFVISQESRFQGIPYILYLCSQLLLELVALDKMQLTCVVQSTPILPKPDQHPSILARISLSREQVQEMDRTGQICTVPPTREELWNVTGTVLYKTFYIEQIRSHVLYTQTEVWSLSSEDDVFLLTRSPRISALMPVLESEPVLFSTYDSTTVLRQKGCDRNQLMWKMFLDLRDRFSVITEDNLREALAWLVQLSYDTREPYPGELVGRYELRVELQRLIEMSHSCFPGR